MSTAAPSRSPASRRAPRKSFLRSLGPASAIGCLAGLASCQEAGFVPPPAEVFGPTLNTPSAEQHPQFSYDGRYLAFASDRQSQRRIWLYDLRQRRSLPLPGLNRPGSWQDWPDISADGRYLVYISEQSGKPDIFVYDRQTLAAKNLTQDWVGEVRAPTISGNGRWIAFESNRSGQWDIVIYDRGLTGDWSPAPPARSGPPASREP